MHVARTPESALVGEVDTRSHTSHSLPCLCPRSTPAGAGEEGRLDEQGRLEMAVRLAAPDASPNQADQLQASGGGAAAPWQCSWQQQQQGRLVPALTDR